MTRDILRERRGRNIALKLITRDLLCALERTAPCLYRLVLIEKSNSADGPHVIVEALALPHGNAHVQQRVA
jgi:hypothetical protein